MSKISQNKHPIHFLDPKDTRIGGRYNLRTASTRKVHVALSQSCQGDGVIQAAKLRVGTSCLERAVQQLFPLELCCDPERDDRGRQTNSFVCRSTRVQASRDAAVAANLRIRNLARKTVILKLK